MLKLFFRASLAANQKYIRQGGRHVHDYLLSGCVFCGTCGYAMVGRTTIHGTSYYKHTVHDGSEDCPIVPRPLVRADKIEPEVLNQLFNMFGNPAAIERAVKSAIPNCDEALSRKQRLEAELAKVQKGRDDVLALIERGAVALSEAEERLRKSGERAEALRGEIGKLEDALDDVPDEQDVRCWVEACTTKRDEIETGQHVDDYVFVYGDDGNMRAGGNSISSFLVMRREDKRNLIRAVFNKPLADRKPAGVYIFPRGESVPHRPKEWMFKLRGHLGFELVCQQLAMLCTQQRPRT